MCAKKIIGWISVGVLSIVALQSAASHASDIEYELKAALLYKTFKFIRWPESAFTHPSAPLNVCILGGDPFGPTIDTISRLPIHGRTVEVKRLATFDAEAPHCHVLFIAASEAERLDMILTAVRNKPVLTVAEISRFAERGGVMNFSVRYNRIRFEVNADMARRAGLDIDAQFMRMVTIVESKDGGNQ